MLDMLGPVMSILFIYIFVSGWRFSTRIASFCGLAITLPSIALSVVPPAGLSSALICEVKIWEELAIVTIAGPSIYRYYERGGSLDRETYEVRH